MNICVVGWYYNLAFYKQLHEYELARQACRVYIVANRPGDTLGMPTLTRANVGLEWGAYNHYLQKVGTLVSTLFIHDDTALADVTILDEIHCEAFDVAYLFGSEDEARMNGGAHGRAIFMSKHAIARFKSIGFWYDVGNLGDTVSAQAQAGIQHFVSDLQLVRERPGAASLRVGHMVVQGLELGYRGALGVERLQKQMARFA